MLGVPLVFASYYGYVFVVSERYLKDVSIQTGFEMAYAKNAGMEERGRRVARTRGCFGCHGQQLEGLVFSDEWDWVDTAVAPNLARFFRDHDAGWRQLR